MKDVLIGAIARIEKHNVSTMRADITLLLAYTPRGEQAMRNYAVVPNVPVMFLWAGGYYIRPEYKRGDLVWVTFATHDIVKGLSGTSDDTAGAIFRRESMAVVCGVAKTNWQIPASFDKEGLLIGHKDGNVLMQVTASKISILGDVEIDGNVSATGEVIAKNKTAPINLSTHTHPTGVGPSGPPNPGT
jgi:hypothetical protein